MHLVGRRIVLDQFDQLVAEHDLAARRRDVLADDEIIARGRLPAARQQAHPVAAPVLPAAHEIRATALERLLQHFGIGCGEIRRRQHIQHLPDREFDDRLVWFRHTAHAGGSVMPRLLRLQKGLRQQIERRKFPFRTGEAAIMRLRLDQGPRPLLRREEMPRSFEEAAWRPAPLPAKSRVVAAATPPDARASRYRPATAQWAKCRR